MKRIISLVLAVVMMLSLTTISVSASEIVDSGTCGDNLTWTFSNEGVLTISGSGPMYNYPNRDSPWYSRSYDIDIVVIEKGITSIGDGAFMGCGSLTSITILDGVTSIGDEAFYGCYNLTGVIIPDSVTSIGGNAFNSCKSLTSITIPGSVTTIGEQAFNGCVGLTSITILDGVTAIGDGAFDYCKSLTSITIPDSVTSIGSSAFADCECLATITIPDSVTAIGDGVFEYCKSLTSITLPDSVTSIGSSAFYDCDSLTSITIPDSVTSIGSSAFMGCGSLTSITILDGVTSIGDEAFYGCYNLTSITIPDSVTSIGCKAFNACDSLTSIAIPGSVTTIGDSAFEWCRSLTSITIPDGVTSIGSSTFEYCDRLTSITIPDSVTYIGSKAFRYCSLRDIYYCGSESQWEAINIEESELNKNATIHYNCTGSADDKTETSPGSVRYFHSWDAEKQIAYFDTDPAEDLLNFGSQVTAATDTSFLANVDELVGQYVLVETKARDDGMIAADILISISPLEETKKGTITSIDGNTVGIDGVKYTVSDEMILWAFSVGDVVLYHLYKGEIVSISIYESNDPEPEPDKPEEPKAEYRFVVQQDPDAQQIEIGEIITVTCKLYCNGELVTDWEQPNISIAHNEAAAPITHGGWTKMADGSYMLKVESTALGTADLIIYESQSDSTEKITVEVIALDPSTFVKEIYHANSLLENETVNIYELMEYIDEFAPSAYVLEKSDVDDWSKVWDDITVLLDTMVDGDAYAKYKFEQADAYEAILLNALQCATEDESALGWSLGVADKTVDIAKKLFKHASEYLWLEHRIELVSDTKFDSYTPQELKKVKDAFENSLKENGYKEAVLITKENADFLGDIMEIATTAQDYAEKLAAYMNLWSVSDYMADVLDAMLLETPSGYEYAPMRDAIIFCRDMIEETNQELFISGAYIRAGALTVNEYAIEKGISLFWKTTVEAAIDSNPKLKVLVIVYKASKGMANFLGNTDGISDEIFKLRVVNQYISSLESSISSIATQYKKTPTAKNAEILLNSVSLLHAFAIEDCNVTSDYVDAVEDAMIRKVVDFMKDVINKVCGNESDPEASLKRYAKMIKEHFEENNRNAATHWVWQLKSDYPEHYPDYAGLIGEEAPLVVPITREYTIECPVDVRVYNASGELVCELDEDGAYSIGEVSAIQIGDRKFISIDNADEYFIECDGYDEGTMTVSISEYQDAEEIRKAVFYDLAVSEDSIHEMLSKLDSTGEAVYTIASDDGTIVADFDSGTEKCTEHTYSAPKFRWDDDYSCEALFACAGHDDVQTVECIVTSQHADTPCDREGKIIYIAAADFEGKTYVDSKSVATESGEHEWDGGRVTKEPTASEEGEKMFTCTVCGETKTEKIDKVEEIPPVCSHVFKNKYCVHCGAREPYEEKVDINYRKIKIVLDGEEITPCDGLGNTVEPFIMSSTGTTYLPLRAVSQALGLNVHWDESTNTVKLTSGGTVKTGLGPASERAGQIRTKITYRNIRVILDGKKLSLVNNLGVAIDPFILNSNSSVYLPLRIIGEALGLTVNWDGDTSTVYLVSKQG